MNWKRIYTSANHEERLDLLVHMMQVIEARQQRWGHRLTLKRRRQKTAHYIGDRRGQYIPRIVSLLIFGIVLITVSATTVATTIHFPLQISGPVIFFYVTSLLGVVMFKPGKWVYRQS